MFEFTRRLVSFPVLIRIQTFKTRVNVRPLLFKKVLGSTTQIIDRTWSFVCVCSGAYYWCSVYHFSQCARLFLPRFWKASHFYISSCCPVTF